MVKLKLFRFFNTICALKGRQLYYQIKYKILPPRPLNQYLGHIKMKPRTRLHFDVKLPVFRIAEEGHKFTLLNKSRVFNNSIEWGWMGNGKLWNYNLQYFDFLNQDDICVSYKEKVLINFYYWQSKKAQFLEPYPVSIRGINIIRFLSTQTNIKRREFLEENLHGELIFLTGRLEYHLLGNHLLENAFALLMGAAYFSEKRWEDVAEGVLKRELEEQILVDGAHFELSPMYHKIILNRLLELIEWYSAWAHRKLSFERILRTKAADMCAWLKNISFENGDVPNFNDSSEGIAFPSQWLLNYARQLGVEPSKIKMGPSGYRSMVIGLYEAKIDFAPIGASYQPGHAHADSLSFILYYKNCPLFVEHGTSTYEVGKRRSLERSSRAHNTVVINGLDQSEVWGGFRVGRRANTRILRDEENLLVANHDGYKHEGVYHSRSFIFKESLLLIEDRLSKPSNAIFYLHLHPLTTLQDLGRGSFACGDNVVVVFENFSSVFFEDYDYAEGFNILTPSKRICVMFSERLTTSIHLPLKS